MRLRWLACALVVATVCLAGSVTSASAGSGFQRCQAATKALPAGYQGPGVCQTTWTCKASPCWFQPYVLGYGMFFKHHGGSFSGQARFTGVWKGLSVPFAGGETCTATAPNGSVAICTAVGSERLVPNGYKVNVLCWAPGSLVPQRYVGGYAFCGLMWRT